MPHSRFATAALAGAALLASALVAPATAVPIFYDFTLTTVSGPLAGEEYRGSFSIDGTQFTREGREDFRPLEEKRLLSFDFTFAGFDFTIADAQGYARNPVVIFIDGALAHMGYLVAGRYSFEEGIGVAIGGSAGNFFVSYRMTHIDPEYYGGYVTVTERPSAVPEPAAVVLLTAGLLALAALRRWPAPMHHHRRIQTAAAPQPRLQDDDVTDIP